ncbi:MAG: tetratricopeptide repeat protein [Spirochaetes bacterium]|nr:tetratricopeptide repeat protein [Spirochaetota bacterium]
MKRLPILVFIVLCGATIAGAQVTSPFALSAQPVVAIPLGPTLGDGTPIYTIGGGASLKAEYTPPFAPFLFGGLGLDASFMPLNGAGKAATFLSLSPALGVQFFPFPRFGVRLSGFGGMYAGIIEAGTIINPVVGGTLDFGYQIKPALAVTLGSTFSYHFTNPDPALLSLGINAGVRYYIGGNKADLRIEPDIQPIFPVFYGHYDNHAAGTVTLRNNSMGPIENVRVSLFVKEYMTTGKPSAVVQGIPRGKESKIDLNALFTTDILSVTEQKKVAGELTVAYTYFGSEVTSTLPVTLTIQPRNGMTWADTAQAASFVTVNDDRVRNFAAQYAADARDKTSLMINWRFRAALALFEALKMHGVGYVADASTPYLKLSAEADAVDLLRFPVETLVAKAGDCDDLSILYAALLESANIQAAFVTTPGHIFVAFDLGLDKKSAGDTFSNEADLIFREDGSVWMPVEVTMVRDGFQRAWKTGAQEWAAAVSGGKTEFVPLLEAWKNFPAVDTGRVLQGAISAPEAVRVYQATATALNQFANAEIKTRANELLSLLNKTPNDAKLRNRLGVLYARFGLLKDARTQFEQVTKNSKDVPASTLINLGNLSYLEGNYQEAFDYYNKALQKDAESVIAILGKARAAYELRKDEEVKKAYDLLLKAAPDTAKNFAYLNSSATGSGRASASDKEVTTWSE